MKLLESVLARKEPIADRLAHWIEAAASQAAATSLWAMTNNNNAKNSRRQGTQP